MAAQFGAAGQAVGASANFLPTAQPSETHEYESNTTNLTDASESERPSWWRRLGVGATLMGVLATGAACQPANAENQPAETTPPVATAEVPERYPYDWMVDPGEVAGSTPKQLIDSWCARLEWAMNNPNTKNDYDQTGEDILPQLVDTSTESGNSYYQYEFRENMTGLTARRLDRSQELFPSDQAYKLRCELLGPVKYKDPNQTDFTSVKEFAIHMKYTLGWQRQPGAIVTQDMLDTVLEWSEGLFTFRLNDFVDPTTGEKKQVWQLEQIHGKLSANPFVY